MDKVRVLLEAMFPSSNKAGWPSFSECVPKYELRFEEALLRWVGDVLEKNECDISNSPVGETLGHLNRLNYAEALRFQLRAVELYFGSAYFVGQFLPDITNDSGNFPSGIWGPKI